LSEFSKLFSKKLGGVNEGEIDTEGIEDESWTEDTVDNDGDGL
jgi:hypothetical protein